MPTSYSLIQNDISPDEGDRMSFTVLRSGDLPGEILYFSTLSGTASFGNGDYEMPGGGEPREVAFFIGAGQSTLNISLDILDDGRADAGQTFRAIIETRPASTFVEVARSATITIQEPVQNTTYDLSPSVTSVTEGNQVFFTITRTGDRPAETVYFSTLSDGTATYGEGDYRLAGGGAPADVAVNFSSGQSSRTVTLDILSGDGADSPESFRAIVQRSASDGVSTYLDRSSYVTINEVPQAANQDPTASGTNRTVAAGESIALSSLFSYSDSDGSVVSFTVTDATAGGGRFVNNGVNQATSGTWGQAPNEIPISQIGNWSFVAGSAGSVDNLRFTATDDDGGYNRTAATATVTVQAAANQDFTLADASMAVDEAIDAHNFYLGQVDTALRISDATELLPAYDTRLSTYVYQTVEVVGPNEELLTRWVQGSETAELITREIGTQEFISSQVVQVETVAGLIGGIIDHANKIKDVYEVARATAELASDPEEARDRYLEFLSGTLAAAGGIAVGTATAAALVGTAPIWVTGLATVVIGGAFAWGANEVYKFTGGILLDGVQEVSDEFIGRFFEESEQLPTDSPDAFVGSKANFVEFALVPTVQSSGLTWLDFDAYQDAIDLRVSLETANSTEPLPRYLLETSTNGSVQRAEVTISAPSSSINIGQDDGSVTFGFGEETFKLDEFTELGVFGTLGRDEVVIGNTANTTISQNTIYLELEGGSDFVDGRNSDKRLVVDLADGDDQAYGGTGNDNITGGIGNDLIIVAHGDNRLFGNEDDDRHAVFSGANEIFSGEDNDLAVGGVGADVIYGGDGNDVLIGDISTALYGRDVLIGGFGDDLMSGGGGADIFIFRPAEGTDTIGLLDVDYDTLSQTTVVGRDFQTAIDILELRGFGYTDASQALANISDQAGHATFVDQGTTIVLFDVSTNDLSSDNFIFG